MNRRELLWSVAAGAMASSIGIVPAGAAESDNLRLSARNAWLWGLPLIEMAEQRAARSTEGITVNTFQHQRQLITAKAQFVTTPNNDTLYSQAWLNLKDGPVKISIPASGGRYYCLPLMDMYSNNFAILGTRASGADPVSVTIVGPRQATDDSMAVRSPTDWVWILGRVLVTDQADLEQAQAFQNGWKISGPNSPEPKSYPKRSASWNEYFSGVQDLMNESPPPITDGAMLRSIAPLISYGKAFDASRFSDAQIEEIKAGIADAPKAMAQVRTVALNRNGWQFPLLGLGNFGDDYAYRAAVAIGGLGALPRVEAMYLRAAGPDLKGFDSAKSWQLKLGKDQLPPVNSFWSLSMYTLTPAGALYFAENSINRYIIGDRTPGLKKASDGSISIWMSRSEPTNGAVNWLPTPTSGNFVLILRAYLPKPQMIECNYIPPTVEQA